MLIKLKLVLSIAIAAARGLPRLSCLGRLKPKSSRSLNKIATLQAEVLPSLNKIVPFHSC